MKRLFRLTKREYYADFFITPPITAVLTFISVRHGVSWAWVGACMVGALAWTLYEYVLHRWISHDVWPFTVLHAWHHDRQRDYIAVHPAATVTFYAVLWATLGIKSSAFMVGFSVGYIVYSIAHTCFHYGRVPSWLMPLKRHHALHHAFHNINFGVSTTLWDRVFGTYRGRKSA